MLLYMLCGYSPYYIYILFKRYANKIVEINSGPIISGIGNFMMNKKICLSGLKTGESIETAYNQLARRMGIERINDIKKMPLVIPTVDILESKEYIFTNNVPKISIEKSQYITDISIGKAVRASSSFPGVFCPCDFKNHKFLDGGVLDNIPVLEIKKQGVDKVIAINFRADDITNESNMMDIAMRTIDIMGNKISEDSINQSDYLLTISTDKGLLDVEKLDKCYRHGYNETMKNIENIKQVLQLTASKNRLI